MQAELLTTSNANGVKVVLAIVSVGDRHALSDQSGTEDVRAAHTVCRYNLNVAETRLCI